MEKPDTPDLPRPGDHLDLVALRGFDRVWGRVPPDGPTFVVRTGTSRVRPVPGEIFTVEVAKSWVFGHTPYIKGEVTRTWLDLGALALEPLGLRDFGPWDPEDEAWLFEEDPHPLHDEIRAAGPRHQDEMEAVVPEGLVELQWEEAPVTKTKPSRSPRSPKRAGD